MSSFAPAQMADQRKQLAIPCLQSNQLDTYIEAHSPCESHQSSVQISTGRCGTCFQHKCDLAPKKATNSICRCSLIQVTGCVRTLRTVTPTIPRFEAGHLPAQRRGIDQGEHTRVDAKAKTLYRLSNFEPARPRDKRLWITSGWNLDTWGRSGHIRLKSRRNRALSGHIRFEFGHKMFVSY